ncbi:hypothetical protein [Kushneria marisflavi]|uniref:Uncharacterized protein n=1 Tax=Kushneria marisflavi TaxID=157779 RepID=A0A240UKV8_9GAMM|nr:hypothetical protein [Kushneria marisflavi]ART62108.1 hypothetical protein B9H00_02645 [Kushneria marisflavi]RKD87183.1 hypothetical protein C8D96_0641 [Kushneria marisflavi]
MPVESVNSTSPAGDTQSSGTEGFDQALEKAQFDQAMNEGMVQVGGQLILMPMMKEMLGEAMSGGED